MTGKKVALKREDARQATSRAENVLTLVSVVFTVALFAYVAWQAATTSAEADPRAHVLGVESMPDGEVLVHVEFRNYGGVGLLSAEVNVECEEPAPSITFENVPADGRRVGTVTCPAGTEGPSVSVSSWVQA